MKPTFYLAIALVLFLNHEAETPIIEHGNSKTAIITFKTELIDYGTIEQHSDGNRIFTFKNEGNECSKTSFGCCCTAVWSTNYALKN